MRTVRDLCDRLTAAGFPASWGQRLDTAVFYRELLGLYHTKGVTPRPGMADDVDARTPLTDDEWDMYFNRGLALITNEDRQLAAIHAASRS